jgi:hypothetical protein
MIDLNGEEFKEREYTPIFNKGVAGRVENVTIRIEKRGINDKPGAPLYKIIAIDNDGAEVNGAFFFKDETDKKNNGFLVSRAVHIARAIIPSDFKFETFDTYAATLDYLFKLIAKESVGKTFNVFVTYGTKGYPSKYLALRYFEFIEAGDVSEKETRLFAKKDDLLERIEEDIKPPNASDFDVLSTDSDDSWI